MTFNTDSHFVIGRYHIRQNKPCQDHAQTYCDDNIAIAVLSDGCSSGGQTDVGSRIITCSALQCLKDMYGNNKTIVNSPAHNDSHIFIQARTAAGVLGVVNDDLLATCSYIVVKNEGGYIQMLGDGATVVKYRDGTSKVVLLQWQNNMPYYLAYRQDYNKGFVDHHRTIEGGQKALKVKSFWLDKNSVPFSDSEMYYCIEDAIAGFSISINKAELQEIESIAIFSDGITDFQDERKNCNLPFKFVLDEMMAFKNHMGEFVKRRVSAALKTLAKEEIYPNDDFSVAVIYFDHDSTDSNDNTST